jgi:hypothetical protein
MTDVTKRWRSERVTAAVNATASPPAATPTGRSPLINHHTRRVCLFGSLQSRKRVIQPDGELFYITLPRCRDA